MPDELTPAYEVHGDYWNDTSTFLTDRVVETDDGLSHTYILLIADPDGDLGLVRIPHKHETEHIAIAAARALEVFDPMTEKVLGIMVLPENGFESYRYFSAVGLTTIDGFANVTSLRQRRRR